LWNRKNFVKGEKPLLKRHKEKTTSTFQRKEVKPPLFHHKNKKDSQNQQPMNTTSWKKKSTSPGEPGGKRWSGRPHPYKRRVTREKKGKGEPYRERQRGKILLRKKENSPEPQKRIKRRSRKEKGKVEFHAEGIKNLKKGK